MHILNIFWLKPRLIFQIISAFWSESFLISGEAQYAFHEVRSFILQTIFCRSFFLNSYKWIIRVYNYMLTVSAYIYIYFYVSITQVFLPCWLWSIHPSLIVTSILGDSPHQSRLFPQIRTRCDKLSVKSTAGNALWRKHNAEVRGRALEARL